MDRRKAMKVAAGAIAAGGAGLLTLTTAFKPEKQPLPETRNLEFTPEESEWEYFHLDPSATAQLAYDRYSEGSCMYATVISVVSQLADKFGEPFTSFPIHMFKYGHGGIGGFGSVCGALNGAAALIGLFVTDKNVQDKMITDLFQWYEKESLPVFNPQNAVFDFTPVVSASNSVLCHASNTNWCKTSGFSVDSKERKERCRRLTGDVAQKVTASLNDIYTNAYITNTHTNEATNSCVACHGNDGKVKNTSVKMSCTSCHSESFAHKAFADVHYKFMK
ncbi:C-GCAxxG-C-C family protein [Mariniphaga sp.]|uniref:C-GCAxxG-C-C family protein n=1 Tax=Mariniphaga sp. TaxID=1954475 RepID=UPI00356408A0